MRKTWKRTEQDCGHWVDGALHMEGLILYRNNRWKKQFLIMVSGQAVSLIGSTAVQFSVIWWLAASLDSPMVLAVASIAAYIPQILMGPFVGVCLERMNWKYVIMAADLFTGSISAVFALFFLAGTPQAWMGYLLLGLRAIGGVFQTPAVQP